MDALILSCSTGGGHNAAAAAIKEALTLRGHHAVMLDPYELAGKNLDRKVGNTYIKIAQKTPRLFGVIYKLGDEYRRLPIRSPVYAVNKGMLGKMQAYLQEHPFDVIFTTHIFPGEILANMKNKGVSLPKRIFVATDYVCVPFTEEIDCDYYVTPGKALNPDFVRRGIPEEKLVPAGIPVRQSFCADISREEALEELGLDPQNRYFLLSGGSMGAGLIGKTVGLLCRHLQEQPSCRLIVICGNNEKLMEQLRADYGMDPRVILIGTTDRMALYMKGCDAFLSKPGGLSSTEAAVSGIPLIHISPIPGCENKNMEFFQQCGMSLAIGSRIEELPAALEKLPELAPQMRANQKKYISAAAAEDICKFAESITEPPGSGT